MGNEDKRTLVDKEQEKEEKSGVRQSFVKRVTARVILKGHKKTLNRDKLLPFVLQFH